MSEVKQRVARRGSRRTPYLSLSGRRDETKTLAQWADELGIPYNTLYERYRTAVREVRNARGLDSTQPVELPQELVEYVLRPARGKPGNRPSEFLALHPPVQVSDPLESFTDVEVVMIRREASRLGIPFRKIRSMLRNSPESVDEIRAMLRGDEDDE